MAALPVSKSGTDERNKQGSHDYACQSDAQGWRHMAP